MKKEKEIVEKIVEKLDVVTADYVGVIASKEYSEERNDQMVVVGVTNVVNVNPTLPDYDFTVQILVDSFIKGDEDGYKHDIVVEQVEDYLNTFLNDQSRLAELFDDIPIVGMFFTNQSSVSNDQSNQTYIILQVIGSWGQ